jgi:hypothetical protein
MPGYSRVPAAAVLAVAVVALSACSHGSAPAPAQPAATATAVSAVPAAETATQFTKSLGATSFQPADMSRGLGGLTGGRAVINGAKYGINCFATHAAMTAWVNASSSLGVSPKWESATCVAYPSVNG